MEIGPITAVRIAPMVRYKETDLGLMDVDEVERSTRIGDETYTPSVARAATGFEDEEDEIILEFDELEEGAEEETDKRPAGSRRLNRVA